MWHVTDVPIASKLSFRCLLFAVTRAQCEFDYRTRSLFHSVAAWSDGLMELTNARTRAPNTHTHIRNPIIYVSTVNLWQSIVLCPLLPVTFWNKFEHGYHFCALSDSVTFILSMLSLKSETERETIYSNFLLLIWWRASVHAKSATQHRLRQTNKTHQILCGRFNRVTV